MGADIRYLGETEIRRALPPGRAREAIAAAYRAIAAGEIEGPVRTTLGGGDESSLIMPALSRQHIGLKVLHLRDGNPARGLPAVMGEMLVWDRPTGELLAVIDATALTAVRTGALAGHATKLLAPEGVRRVALLGAGGQGYDQALALIEATGAQELRIWNRTRERAQALAGRLGPVLPGVQVAVADSARQAVAGAGAITLVTASSQPLLAAADLAPEAHLNAMGAYRPDMAEIGPDIVGGASAVFVDNVAGARGDAGELIQAAAQGRFDMAGLQDLRVAPGARSGWTLFKSVGAALFDLAVAEELLRSVHG
jgi:ornithine cyclodeaminase